MFLPVPFRFRIMSGNEHQQKVPPQSSTSPSSVALLTSPHHNTTSAPALSTKSILLSPPTTAAAVTGGAILTTNPASNTNDSSLLVESAIPTLPISRMKRPLSNSSNGHHSPSNILKIPTNQSCKEEEVNELVEIEPEVEDLHDQLGLADHLERLKENHEFDLEEEEDKYSKNTANHTANSNTGEEDELMGPPSKRHKVGVIGGGGTGGVPGAGNYRAGTGHDNGNGDDAQSGDEDSAGRGGGPNVEARFLVSSRVSCLLATFSRWDTHYYELTQKI